MIKTKIMVTLVSCFIFLLSACDKGTSPKKGSVDAPAATPPVSAPIVSKAAPAPATSRFVKIGDILDAWSALYKQNEKVINKYEGDSGVGVCIRCAVRHAQSPK
jgi:hypothetical protein